VAEMSNDLLQKLMAAQTDEERSWIVIENLLESLPEDVKSALWALAIPHWFDADILAALCPELADHADEIYRQLQTISCVEMFPERGHNVHELTRNQLLDRLWQDNPERFRELSAKAASYFADGNKPEMQIERIYHLVIAEPANENSELFNLAQLWSNNYRKAEVESLILNLHQHIAANRVTVAVKAETSFWDGKIKFRFYQATAALESYEAALSFYSEIGDWLGEANTLQEIGDVLLFLERSNEALQWYEVALTYYSEIGDCLGKANTLKALGNVLQFLKQSTEALEKYEIALSFYREIGTCLGEANTLKAIGDLFRLLKRRIEALEKYEAALAFYRKIDAHLGEANTLKAMAMLAEDYVIGLTSTQNDLNQDTQSDRNEPISVDEASEKKLSKSFLNSELAKSRLQEIKGKPLAVIKKEIRSQLRSQLAKVILYVWVATIILCFVDIGFDKYIYSTHNTVKVINKDLITLILSAQSSLVGAVIGFYFGTRDTK
jgi:tetratricopeptide (TPR) repeat protein